MLLNLIWLGRTRDKLLAALADEYLKRIRRFVECKVIVVRGEKVGKGHQASGLERETKRLLAAAREGYNVLLDPRGKQLSSEELAGFLERHMQLGTKRLNFISGGPGGVSPRLQARADMLLSLSRMTFTHEMSRVILAEQLYRALTIIRGLPYQK